MQIACTNLVAGCYVYSQFDNDDELEKYGGACVLQIAGAVMQILFICFLFALSIQPKYNQREERLWIVRAMAMFYFILGLGGLIILPLVSLIWTLLSNNRASNAYLALIVGFINTLMFSIIATRKILFKLHS